MASAYKCDRCKNLYERATVPSINIRKYTHGYGEETIDLCPECQRILERWLKMKGGLK